MVKGTQSVCLHRLRSCRRSSSMRWLPRQGGGLAKIPSMWLWSCCSHRGSSCRYSCHPLWELLVWRERRDFQSSCAACCACCLLQARCSCFLRLETAFQAALAAGPGGLCWAVCRSCLSWRLSWNLLVPRPGHVMALEIAATTLCISSPLGMGMSRSCLICCGGRRLRGPQVARLDRVMVRGCSIFAGNHCSFPRCDMPRENIVKPPGEHGGVVRVVAG